LVSLSPTTFATLTVIAPAEEGSARAPLLASRRTGLRRSRRDRRATVAGVSFLGARGGVGGAAGARPAVPARVSDGRGATRRRARRKAARRGRGGRRGRRGRRQSCCRGGRKGGKGEVLASGELGKGRVIGGCVGSVRLLVAVAELRLDGVRAREDPQSLASTSVFSVLVCLSRSVRLVRQMMRATTL
jgi:hypothetical protein